MFRRKAVLSKKYLRRIERIILCAHKFYGNFVRHKLQTVAVSRNHHAVLPILLAGGRERTENIVALKAFAAHDRVAERSENLLYQRELHPKLFRHPVPVGLILGILLMPEGFARNVKCDCHRIRTVLF